MADDRFATFARGFRTVRETTAGRPKSPDYEIVRRLMRLPVVRSGFDAATSVYSRLKTSNGMVARGLDCAEKTATTVADMSAPFVNSFGEQINTIDQLMCETLDAVERNVPMVTRSPREIYYATGSLIRARVEPALKRVDSVKQLAMLDDVLSAADTYVDRYLPDEGPDEDRKPSAEPFSQIAKTIRHVNRFSKKLQRRLTHRMIAEAKLLEQQGRDTVECFLRFTRLLATDPKAFARKMKAVWTRLGHDEPEHPQRTPENVEQLIGTLFVEAARRFVHATNLVVENIYKTSASAKRAFVFTVRGIVDTMNKYLKNAHLEKMKRIVADVINMQLAKYAKVLDDLKNMIYLSFSDPTANEPKNKDAAQRGKRRNVPKPRKMPKKSSSRK